MTSTEVRTYVVGEIAPHGLRATGEVYCGANTSEGWICSLPPRHLGPQHLTIAQDGNRVVGASERDTSGDFAPPSLPITNDVDTAAMRTEIDRLRRELGASEERVAARETEAASLRRIRDNLIAENERKDERYAELQRTVVRVAMEKAREHNWCSVVQQALEDMGLDVKTRYRVATDVIITNGDWKAKLDSYVTVTIESTSPEQAWRDVDNTTEWDDVEALLGTAGIELPDGWDFDRFDASTSGVEALGDDD